MVRGTAQGSLDIPSSGASSLPAGNPCVTFCLYEVLHRVADAVSNMNVNPIKTSRPGFKLRSDLVAHFIFYMCRGYRWLHG